MNKLKIAGLLALLLVLAWWLWSPSTADLTDPGQAHMRMLEAQNDSLIRVNQGLDGELLRLQQQADSLRDLVRQDRALIFELNTQSHEKISAIAGYDGDELYRFFTDYPVFTTDRTAH